MRPAKATLDPTRHSYESQQFEIGLRQRIIGQEDGIRALADLFQPPFGLIRELDDVDLWLLEHG